MPTYNTQPIFTPPTVYDFPLAYGENSSTISADFKLTPEDFVVEEQLNFEFTGQGEHICLFIEKTNLSTTNIVNLLSRQFGISQRDISYAGLKDKQAITRQWFSIRTGVKTELDWQKLDCETVKVLNVKRNIRKIRRGSHSGNKFTIRLQNFNGELATLLKNSIQIREHGVPNYFGPQRFGFNMGNVTQAFNFFSEDRKIKDKFLRGLYISAARSWLFNQVLAKRVRESNWNTYLAGDVMSLSGTASNFVPESWDSILTKRLHELDIHPSGPLWGKGALSSSEITATLEYSLQQEYPCLCSGLAKAGLRQERRALRLPVQNLKVNQINNDNLLIEFSLGKGAFATSVLREMITIRNWRI